uniref:Spondin-like TSP1 domain-containing protein n=1 Tax=Eptatretus burgeri TaxID=7764 RepID=A0A8C4WV93_EPTBU
MMAVLWGTVILTSDITPGHQYRRGPSAMRGAGVCVDGDGDCKSQDFQPVRSDLCGSQCSNACVLSLWEAWSPCVVIRCGQGSRVRSRRVIGPPPPLGATCADLVQTEACPPPRDACTPVGHEGPSTEGRSWFQVGLWSICLPSASPSPASRSRLGHKHVSEGALWKVEMGWRRRDVTCVADDGFEISIQNLLLCRLLYHFTCSLKKAHPFVQKVIVPMQDDPLFRNYLPRLLQGDCILSSCRACNCFLPN